MPQRIWSKIPHSRTVFDPLACVCKGVMSAGASGMDLGSDFVIILLAEGVIGPFSRALIVGLSGGINGIRLTMSTGV